MEILAVREEVPAPTKRIDYALIAENYNTLQVGQVLKIAPVYNTTLFRKCLENHHALKEADVEIYQRKGACFMRRKSLTAMV